MRQVFNPFEQGDLFVRGSRRPKFGQVNECLQPKDVRCRVIDEGGFLSVPVSWLSCSSASWKSGAHASIENTLKITKELLP